MMPSPQLTSPWLRSAQLWLFTNLIGSLLYTLYSMMQGGSEAMQYGLVVGLFGALCSLPVILLATPVFNWLLSKQEMYHRQVGTFLVITAFWLVAILAFTLAFDMPYFSVIIELAPMLLPFYFAALLAGAYVYRQWLFPADE